MNGARRRGRNGERHIRLPHWLLRSPAWCCLSPNGKAVLLHLWERHNGMNNGDIVYAVRDAEDVGVSKSNAARALAELIDKGFLLVTRASGFTVKTKEARCWAITAEPIESAPATKNFMFWTDPKNKTQSHGRDRQSHGRDRDLEKATILPVSVPRAGPSTPKNTPSQSHGRDTSIYTMVKATGGDVLASAANQKTLLEERAKNRRAPRFGDAAFAERTKR